MTELKCGVTWGNPHIHAGKHHCAQLLNEHSGSHTCDQCDAELPLDAVHIAAPALPAVELEYQKADNSMHSANFGAHVKEAIAIVKDWAGEQRGEMGDCPMCIPPSSCPGGAHRNALYADGIETPEQYRALVPPGGAVEQRGETPRDIDDFSEYRRGFQDAQKMLVPPDDKDAIIGQLREEIARLKEPA